MEKERPKKKILIVDDEMDMKIFLSTLFETKGYEPVVSKDGKEGLDKARAVMPDLIILDVMMPGEGGVLMYKKLKSDERLRQIPVIILSAVPRKTYQHYLKLLHVKTGAAPEIDAYFEKPPDAEALINHIETMIHSNRKGVL